VGIWSRLAYPADRLLGDARTRWSGACTDGLGRADGPWRDDQRHRGTGDVAISPPDRLRSFGRWGLAAGLAIVLSSTPAASDIGDTVRVFDPLADAASLLVIVTACVLAASVPAFRATRVDPIVTLRAD
jgi:hypothetical protein